MRLAVAVAVALLFGAAVAAAPDNVPWPLPRQATWGGDVVWLCGSAFQLVCAGACGRAGACAVLEHALARYRALILDEHAEPQAPRGCVSRAVVDVASADERLNLGVDESYSLSVSSAGISVSAKSVFGALLGLESLSQLVRFDAGPARAFFVGGAPWAISDAPRFSHRELLLDSSRHYLPLRALEQMIATLPAAKINVLHWHLTDDQSVALCSRALPKLCEAASYSREERYSPQDLERVVAFARLHGVRVMVEVDIPGHTAALCRAYPEACERSGHMVSPAQPAFEATISALLAELRSIFTDSYIHLGGDEVDVSWYDADPASALWLRARNLTGGGKTLYKAAVDFAHQEALRLGWIPVGWSEIWANFGARLDNRTVVEKWRGEDSMADITAAGYHALWCNYNEWYLDLPKTSWEAAYKAEPCEGLSEQQCLLVLGGGGQLWGEHVDVSDLQSSAWPRLAAIGERLWSPRAQTGDTAQALPRLAQLRCLLNRRGVAAAPVLNPEARQPPGGPHGCYTQPASVALLRAASKQQQEQEQ
jgi:hexosaminidase